MRKLLHHYRVDPSFLRVLFSFGEEPHLSESSSSFLNFRSEQDSQETEISYLLNYVEENRRPGRNPWSNRYTGVYHRHTADCDLFIMLHPIKDSVLESNMLATLGFGLTSVVADTYVSSELAESPFRLHSVILGTFLDNWRWYFRYLGEKFATEVKSLGHHGRDWKLLTYCRTRKPWA